MLCKFQLFKIKYTEMQSCRVSIDPLPATNNNFPATTSQTIDFPAHLHLRSLNLNDIDQLKSLCYDCFPIKYPECWYKSTTSDPKYTTIAACLPGTDNIVAVLVAEHKLWDSCNVEDRKVLLEEEKFPSKSTYVTYILR